MKVVLGAAVAAMLAASPALAQTTPAATPPPTACAALPSPPTLPDGAAADRNAMAAGNATFTEWTNVYIAALQCRRDEVTALRAQLEARVAEHNAAAEVLNATNRSWEADVAEYNERGGDDGRTRGNTRRPPQ
jgi:hypothetical protein